MSNFLFLILSLITLNTFCNNDLLQQALHLANTSQYEQALAAHNTLLEKHPNNVDLLHNRGFLLKKLNRYHDAIITYEHALQFEPYSAKLLRGISHAYLILGDFQNGWPAYEYRWVNPPSYVQEFKSYLRTHDTLKGKTILIKTEYGLGDTMQFIRYIKNIKNLGATVIVESQKPLVNILSLCPYIDKVIPMGAPLPNFDFQCLLMSLPLVFDTTQNTIPNEIPYLYAKKQLIKKWEPIFNHDFFNIGICWHADTHKGSNISQVHIDSNAKSIPVALIAQLSKLPKIRLYSLQKINGLDQLKHLPTNVKIHSLGSDFDETSGPFMDTAAVMTHLDLIITIDTSISHLAGGLGVPTWTLLPHHADWRWLLDRNDSPWYPTMKLFRQKKTGDWENVIQNIRIELEKLI